MNWSLKTDALKTMQNEHHGNTCTEKNSLTFKQFCLRNCLWMSQIIMRKWQLTHWNRSLESLLNPFFLQCFLINLCLQKKNYRCVRKKNTTILNFLYYKPLFSAMRVCKWWKYFRWSIPLNYVKLCIHLCVDLWPQYKTYILLNLFIFVFPVKPKPGHPRTWRDSAQHCD